MKIKEVKGYHKNQKLFEASDSGEGITVLYPGAFKPITGGHLDLIEKYSRHPDVDKVKVIVSPKEREGITQEDSFRSIKHVIDKFDNVEVEKSEYASPLTTAYKYIEEAKPGVYTLASSTKGKDYQRVSKFIEQHQPDGKYYETLPEGVKVVELAVNVSPNYYENRDDENAGKPISATIARQDLRNDDYENFKTNYPQLDSTTIKAIYDELKNLKESLNEATVPSGYTNKTPEDRYKSLFVEDENDEDEDENEYMTDSEVDAYIKEINDSKQKYNEDVRIPYDYEIFLEKKEVNKMEDRDPFTNAFKIADGSPNIDIAIGYLVEEEDERGYIETTEHAWNLDSEENVMDKTLGYEEDSTYVGRKVEVDEFEKYEDADQLRDQLYEETHINRKNESQRVKKKVNKLNESAQRLFEGGGAGHMKNIWEATDLTFEDLKDLINQSLKGNLSNISEKLDGQNLMITWKDGAVRGARNKGQLKNWGENSLSIKEISDYFEGRGAIQEAFVEALKDFENALKDIKMDVTNFFKEGKNWLNLEVLYPETENVIPYGDSQLRIHHVREVDEKGNTVDVRSEDKLNELIEQIELIQARQDKTFLIKKTNPIVVKRINKSNEIAQNLIGEIEKLQNSEDLTDDNTIQDYVNKSFEKYINDHIPDVSDEIKESLIKRWGEGVKKPPINKLIKGLDEESVEWIRKTDKSVKDIYKGIIKPLEFVFLRLGTTVLNNLEGLATTSPVETSKKIQDKTQEAINKLQDVVQNEKADAEKLNKLSKFLGTHLERLEETGGIDYIAPTEGIVFEYKGKLFKLTGNFGPVNQLIGYLKFGK